MSSVEVLKDCERSQLFFCEFAVFLCEPANSELATDLVTGLVTGLATDIAQVITDHSRSARVESRNMLGA